MRQKQFEILDALGIVVWKKRDPHFLPLAASHTCDRNDFNNDFNKLVNEFVDHSSVNTHQSSMMPFVQKLNARCWVLLQSSLTDPQGRQEPECQKIFEGMLKVLNLNADSYCTSSIRELNLKENEGLENIDSVHLLNSLITWCPKTVLVLGSELGAILGQAKESLPFPLPFTLKVTYHPNELWREPQKKKQAYRELLELKEVLENLEGY